MNHTIIQLDIIKFSESYCSWDPNIYIFGFINMDLLDELLAQDEALNEMVGDIEHGTSKTVTIKVWEDSDDYRTWLDYKVLPKDFVLPLPPKDI